MAMVLVARQARNATLERRNPLIEMLSNLRWELRLFLVLMGLKKLNGFCGYVGRFIMQCSSDGMHGEVKRGPACRFLDSSAHRYFPFCVTPATHQSVGCGYWACYVKNISRASLGRALNLATRLQAKNPSAKPGRSCCLPRFSLCISKSPHHSSAADISSPLRIPATSPRTTARHWLTVENSTGEGRRMEFAPALMSRVRQVAGSSRIGAENSEPMGSEGERGLICHWQRHYILASGGLSATNHVVNTMRIEGVIPSSRSGHELRPGAEAPDRGESAHPRWGRLSLPSRSHAAGQEPHP